LSVFFYKNIKILFISSQKEHSIIKKKIEEVGFMDVFSLMIFRLESYILRIKEIYSYIFKFFLPGMPDDEVDEGGSSTGGIAVNRNDKLHL